MTSEMTKDWNPGAYDRFRGLRLQPAMDLLSRVEDLPNGTVVDLGCGNGVMGEALQRRFPRRRIVGVDNSHTMLEQAAARRDYAIIQEGDIATWKPDLTPALICSNAALQWLDDHETLLPRLAGLLPAGGVLAVQMPHQNPAPSHAGWDQAFAALFGDTAVERGPSILGPEQYFDLLSPLGELQVWEVDYLQHLEATETGHPVRRFTESTYARPFLNAVEGEDRDCLIEAYEAIIAPQYERRADGSCLFPFRRLFFTLRVF